MAEAFGHDRDAQPGSALAQRRRVIVCGHPVLARVEAVGPRQHLEQQRVVSDRRAHRPGVVDGQLDRHDPGVRHQAVGRLHAVDAAERRRNADRAAPIATDRHVDLAGRDQRRAPRRRAARRMAAPVRIVYRA
jgi:hypothetical protein